MLVLTAEPPIYIYTFISSCSLVDFLVYDFRISFTLIYTLSLKSFMCALGFLDLASYLFPCIFCLRHETPSLDSVFSIFLSASGVMYLDAFISEPSHHLSTKFQDF